MVSKNFPFTVAIEILVLLLPLSLFSVPLELEKPNKKISPPEEKSLIVQTLSEDIRTASYYELVSWCNKLGLKETGDKRTLEKRLLSYYGIKTPEEIEKQGRVIKIESARQTEYFDIESVKEKYITLRGNVVLKMEDKDRGITHLIKADKILFNQSKDLITAEGNLVYKIISNNAEEVFKGESLTFNVNTWEGVFYKGLTEKEVGESKNKFYFYGDEITRSKNDIVIMNNGNITSCSNLEAPHYHIHATKIWLLAPGEWAIQNAVLYIGRIPVMFVPFFFYPGDQLFFHPVIGYRQREGNFIQTTTYLIGRKKQQQNILSFLQLEGGTGGYYEQKLRGLFLRKTRKRVPQVNKDFLKVMLDVYSRLGCFSGIAGSFKNLISFKGGIGVSRDIFYDETTSFYTPYYVNSTGALAEKWNTVNLFGWEVPFRFGLEGKLGITKENFSLSGNFETYSDPSFPEDFYNRSEGFSLDSILNPGQSINNTTLAPRNTLSWFLGAKIDFSKYFSKYMHTKFVKSISLPYLNIKYQLRSKESIQSTLPNVDPMRYFYYPVSFKLPELSMKINGSLLDWSSSTVEAKKPEKIVVGNRNYPGKGLEFDEIESVLNKKTNVKTESQTGQTVKSTVTVEKGIVVPKIMPDVNVREANLVSKISTTYQITPQLTYETMFDTASWQTSSDVDYSILYSTLQTYWNSSLRNDFSLFGNLLGLGNSIILSGVYNSRFNKAADLPISEWNTLLINDYKQRQLNLKDSLGLSFKPFILSEGFKETGISYNLSLLLYTLRYNGVVGNVPMYSGVGVSFTKDFFLTHNISALFKYGVSNDSYSLSLQYNLPPLDQKIITNLNLKNWIFTTTSQAGLSFVEGKEVFDPFVFSEQVDFCKDFSLHSGFTYNLNKENFEQINFEFILYGLSASLLLQYMYPINPYGETVGTERILLPSVVALRYNLPGVSYYFWKNRIKLSFALSTNWHINIQKYSDNNFNFLFKFNLSIYKFLELAFSSESYNRHTYLYIPSMAEGVDMKWVNPLSDLLRSFNFFNIEDRYASSFKIKNLSFRMIHHLHDWDVSVQYSGSPTLKTENDGTRRYVWEPTFSIFVKWNAIPQIKARVEETSTGFDIGGG